MRLTSPLLLLLAAPLLATGLSAQAAEVSEPAFDPADWFDVRITGLTRDDVTRLTLDGVDIQSRKGTEVLAYMTTERFEALAAEGYDVTALPRVTRSQRVGYHTFAELTAFLQTIEATYPSICELHNIGDSTLGRELWFMKISDNVSVEENEPEFKYMSSMHGDEVVGMELCIELIDLMTSQYGTDPQITDLINDVEIWIMPLVNPDGYADSSRYNAQGHDLNREFPDRVVDPNNTTSGRPTEVVHVMNWGFAHSPVLSANFHGGALCVNYPYDSDPDYWASYSATPDDALIIQQSLVYSTLNIPMYNSPWFSQGITNGVEWYLIYGGMQDWNYVWQGCNDVTIELDDDKWPPYSRIPTLWNENRDSMLAYMELCLEGVRGLVTDSITGAPVAATVQAVGIAHDVYTDPDVGDYHRMLLPGTYSMQYSASGYVTKTVTGVSVGSGSATVVDVALMPEGLNLPRPDIKIDGQDGPLSVPGTQAVRITAQLAPQDLVGIPHDWWITATDGVTTYYWIFPRNWFPVQVRAYNGGLFSLPPITIDNTILPVGTWTITFAVDARDNVYQGTYSDSITITSY